MDLLDRLLVHDEWATAHLLAFSRDLTDDQLDREFDIGHRTLRRTYEHIIFITDFWTRVMTGSPITPPTTGRTIPELEVEHPRVYATFARFARQIRDEGRLGDLFTDHHGEQMSFEGAILHLILHGDEHRTEAVHILHRLDVGDVPEVDHGLWDFVVRGKFNGYES